MSRPIYEPSLPRADAELGYGNRQLFRRPSPRGETGALQNAYLFWDAGQSIANDSTVTITGYSTGVDGESITADETNGAFFIADTGIYLLQAITLWDNTFAGGKMARIAWVVGNALQDTNYAQQWVSDQDTGTNVDMVTAEALVFVTTIGAGDNKFQVHIRQTSGVSQLLASIDFSIVRLSEYVQFSS